MPILPVSRSSGTTRSRRVKTLQPSAADVQTISPGVSRDPGLNVPLIESPLGVAAEELAPVFEEIGERIRIREEKIEKMRSSNFTEI